jgi:hypothetical protein
MTGLRAKTSRAQPFHWGGWDGALASRMLPLGLTQTASTYQQKGAGYAATSALAEFFGFSTNIYREKEDAPSTTAEKLAARFAYHDSFGNSTLSKELREQLSDLKARARRGDDVTAEVDRLVDDGAITEQRADAILNAKDETKFEELIGDIKSTKDIEHVLRYATPEERAEAEPILKKKLENQEKRAKVEPYRVASARTERALPLPPAVEAELKRLKGADVEPPEVGRKITVAGREHELTPAEYSSYRANYLKALYPRLQLLFDNTHYKEVSDERKLRLVKMEKQAVSEAALAAIRSDLLPQSKRAERDEQKATRYLDGMDIERMLRKQKAADRRNQSYER